MLSTHWSISIRYFINACSCAVAHPESAIFGFSRLDDVPIDWGELGPLWDNAAAAICQNRFRRWVSRL
jgi:hypothetical protein